MKITRREFLFGGSGLATLVLASSCKDKHDPYIPPSPPLITEEEAMVIIRDKLIALGVPEDFINMRYDPVSETYFPSLEVNGHQIDHAEVTYFNMDKGTTQVIAYLGGYDALNPFGNKRDDSFTEFEKQLMDDTGTLHHEIPEQKYQVALESIVDMIHNT